jgi:hypothetical protein
MPRAILFLALLLLAAPQRCGHESPPPLDAPPRIGDHVRLRGTLGDDVDCRLFRSDAGPTYSLSVRLNRYANGTKLCIEGTLTDATGCIQSPMIDVQRLFPPSQCR